MDIGTIRPVSIDTQMRESYLDYAMSVIVARALPDARDGLKPVHRRILYVMHDMGLRPNGSYKKSARIVGEVLGKYHPHGDQAVYDAMVRLAQDFSMRYMLVDGQGNFGSIDGDAPAAMRYTEAKMKAIAEEILADLNLDTVDWSDNFDGSLQEPNVLPARIPNMLINGSSGIAVGMATNIPPHNLREIAQAASYLIDHYDTFDEVSVDDLMQFVKGPDFPTGASILASDELREMYATGRGRLIVRATCSVEEIGKNGERQAIIVTEIPYQANKVAIIERIAQLVKEDKLDEISDLRDESDRKGMRIVIELKRAAQPLKTLNKLYKFTQLQSTFGVQMLALVDNEPRTLSLKRALQVYIEHRREVIRRRSEFQLAKARARAHILEGYLKALANIDDIIRTIREAEDTDTARENLMILFDLTEIQAQAILELQLRRIASLERKRIDNEYTEVAATMSYLEDLLAHPKKILALIQTDLAEVAAKYGDERRTRLDFETVGEFEETDFIREEEVLIALTKRGFIKRSPTALYRTQGRGGRGVTGITTRDEDNVELLLSANSHGYVLCFTNFGKVYALRAYQVPEADRTGKGQLISNLIALNPDEKITGLTCVDNFDAGYFVMVTRNAKIKRVEISEFSAVRTSGLIAITLDDDDRLEWVRRTSGEDHLIVVTAYGMAIRFDEREVRVMGRGAAGVNAIRLNEGDYLAGVDVIDQTKTELLIVTRKGFGKRSPLNDYRLQGRYGMGLRTIGTETLKKQGVIVSVHTLTTTDEITVITREGMSIRMRASEIRLVRRPSGVVRLINKLGSDHVVSVAVVGTNGEDAESTTLTPLDANDSGVLAEDADALLADMGDMVDDSDIDQEGAEDEPEADFDAEELTDDTHRSALDHSAGRPETRPSANGSIDGQE
ncbi:MAG TPA: DNA gyrase subunit A [Aggregatilineales bacterium]|nr:DNA gyrase subunit A [Aggregatilineales bacterium]